MPTVPAPRVDRSVVAAVAVGVVLRFINLGAAPLWFDETFSVYHVSAPWHGFVGSLMRDNQAPIYYATLKAWITLAGSFPWAMRVPGVLASAACIPLIAAIAAALAGRRAAGAAAWLAAVSPFLVQHAQDARPYAMLAAFAAADLLVLVRFVQGKSERLSVLWIVLAIAVIETHFYGIFFLAGEGLALLILRPQPVRSWLPAGLIAAGLCAPVVLAALHSASGIFAGQYVLGMAALPGVVWSLLTGYTLMPTSEALHALGPRAILPDLPIALATLPAFAIVAWRGLRAIEPRGRVVVLSAFGTALLLPFVYRLIAGAGVHPRYCAAALAPMLSVVAAGMAAGAHTRTRALSTIVVAVVMLSATGFHLSDPGHGREDVAAAGRWLDANVPETEEILITSIEMEQLARFHWPRHRFRRFPSAHGPLRSDEIAPTADAMPFPGSGRAIFIVGRAWVSDPDGEFQKALAERYTACDGTEVRGISIFCFRPGTTP